MKLLAIETSSAVGTVALAAGGTVEERTIPTPREQTERVLPLIDELLAGSDLTLDALDAIVFGRGPGSFTGLRVAAAVAQGLALATRRPLIGVSSLEAIAQRGFDALGAETALVCVDARMREVYWGLYRVRGGLAGAALGEAIGPPAAVPVPAAEPFAALGDAFARFEAELAAHRQAAERVVADLGPRARDLLPRARAEAAAGRFVVPADALPVYLRSADAWRKSPPI